MAALRRVGYAAAPSTICRACFCAKSTVARSQRFTSSLQTTERRVIRPALVPVRWHSASSGTRVYDFEAMKKYAETPSSERVIVDVREPSEYEEGYIPGAINIPIKSQPDAMFLPEDEFEDRFGFPKPETDKEMVFYCKAGVRSSAAAQLAIQQGYNNVREYRGSWLDWQKQGGKEVRPGMSTESTTGS